MQICNQSIYIICNTYVYLWITYTYIENFLFCLHFHLNCSHYLKFKARILISSTIHLYPLKISQFYKPQLTLKVTQLYKQYLHVIH